MKEIWAKEWDEFTVWFRSQWKYAWDLLSTSIIALVKAVFEWAYAILGAAIGGLWKLVIVPVGKYALDTIINWIKKI